MRSHDRRVITIGTSTSASTTPTVTSVIGGAETISTSGEREDDDGFGEDVDRRAGAELIGDVRRARHRLDQRRRSAPGVKQVIGGEIAREQAFGGNGRRSIDDALPHPLCPRQEHRAQHVEHADAKRQQRDERARVVVGHIAHSRDTTGAVRTCSGSTTSRSNPNTASAPAASISAASPATGTSSNHRQRSRAGSQPDHRS